MVNLIAVVCRNVRQMIQVVRLTNQNATGTTKAGRQAATINWSRQSCSRFAGTRQVPCDSNNVWNSARLRAPFLDDERARAA